jgi:hypothetical protein
MYAERPGVDDLYRVKGKSELQLSYWVVCLAKKQGHG